MASVTTYRPNHGEEFCATLEVSAALPCVILTPICLGQNVKTGKLYNDIWRKGQGVVVRQIKEEVILFIHETRSPPQGSKFLIVIKRAGKLQRLAHEVLLNPLSDEEYRNNIKEIRNLREVHDSVVFNVANKSDSKSNESEEKTASTGVPTSRSPTGISTPRPVTAPLVTITSSRPTSSAPSLSSTSIPSRAPLVPIKV